MQSSPGKSMGTGSGAGGPGPGGMTTKEWAEEEAGLIPDAGGEAADLTRAGEAAGEGMESPKKSNRRGEGERGGANAGATPRRSSARAGMEGVRWAPGRGHGAHA